MTDLEKLSEKIALNANLNPKEKFGSVLIAIMIVGILINVVRVIQECEKKQLYGTTPDQKATIYRSSIKNLSIRRGWYTKMRLRKILRSHMPVTDYRQHGANLCNSILAAGESISVEQVHSLIEASNV